MCQFKIVFKLKEKKKKKHVKWFKLTLPEYITLGKLASLNLKFFNWKMEIAVVFEPWHYHEDQIRQNTKAQ